MIAAVFAVAAALVPVSVQFQDFGPSQVDLLPGQTVQWNNGSERTHTVTADDGSFDSGDLSPGDQFTREFDSVGAFPYHCTKHFGMVGEIDVQAVTLGPLPVAAVPAGDQIEFEGRTSDASKPVRIERSTDGWFTTVATTMPAADGSWKVNIAAQTTGDYRAANDAGPSRSRHLIVSERKVLLRATRRGIAVTVIPALPYARVIVQEDLRERFGWWDVKSARLDYVSAATFAITRPARVRVILVDKDGWTALATSPELTLGHVKRTPKMPIHHMGH